MASLEANLITYLKTIGAVTSLVGSGDDCRIYIDAAKQGVALPYIVITSFEGGSYEHLNGISGVGRTRLQIDCYASTPDGAKTLAEAVRLAPLQMYRGAMGSGWVNGVTSPDGYRSGRELPATGGNEYKYWVSRDYVANYQESVSS